MGINRRLKRFFAADGKTVLVPLDHGVYEGLLPGLEDMPTLIGHIVSAGARGVVLHKGLARACLPFLPPELGLIVHLSAGTRHGLPSYSRTLVCSVAEALRLGADAVSVHVNIGNDMEERMLSDLGVITEEAHLYGLPVLAMIYARGGQIVNEADSSLVTHCIRLGVELGADMIKVAYSGDAEGFARAVQSAPVPVILAGGSKSADFESFQDLLREGLTAGARGVSLGRNIFQHSDPALALKQIVSLVHGEKNRRSRQVL